MRARRLGGDLVLVRGRNDSSLRFSGYATWDGAGQPQIILNMTALSQLPLIMTRFTFYHECTHLVLRTADEVQASCEGLKLMRAKGDLAQGDELMIKTRAPAAGLPRRQVSRKRQGAVGRDIRVRERPASERRRALKSTSRVQQL